MVASIPNIALYGFMGCGKSTLGKRLADALQRSFIDLDSFIEKERKQSIVDIFEEHGESFFRELEHASLRSCCLHPEPHVLSLGGGALLREDSRILVEKEYSIYTLLVPFSVVEERLRLSVRPLNLRAESLFQERSAHYQSIGTPIALGYESIENSYQKLVEVVCAA